MKPLHGDEARTFRETDSCQGQACWPARGFQQDECVQDSHLTRQVLEQRIDQPVFSFRAARALPPAVLCPYIVAPITAGAASCLGQCITRAPALAGAIRCACAAIFRWSEDADGSLASTSELQSSEMGSSGPLNYLTGSRTREQ